MLQYFKEMYKYVEKDFSCAIIKLKNNRNDLNKTVCFTKEISVKNILIAPIKRQT